MFMTCTLAVVETKIHGLNLNRMAGCSFSSDTRTKDDARAN